MTSRRLKYTLSSMLLGTLLRLPGVAEAASTDSSPPYSAPIGADLADFSSALPILVVDTLGSGPLTKDGVDHPSTLPVFAPSLDNGSSFGRSAQLASAMTLSVRGSSSAESPKQSFTIA